VKYKEKHENHSKLSLPSLWEIIRKKNIVIWWLILYNPTKRKGVFLRISLRLLPRKYEGSERATQRAISSEYFHREKAVPRQVES
jgi:hypothetical protein